MESKYACEALKNHDVLKINYHGYTIGRLRSTLSAKLCAAMS